MSAVVEHRDNQVTGLGTPDDLIRLASDGKISMDVLERLLVMRKEIAQEQARTDFNIAMTAAQSEIGRVAANQKNEQTKSKYADYAALDRSIRPIYVKHGFALSFDTGTAASPDSIRCVCHVSHRGGHTKEYHLDMPADGKGAKGGDVMTKTHAAGAAMSYGMRYLLKMIFNVAIGEDDKDGNQPKGETINEKQAADLLALIEEVKADKAKFLKWAGVETIEEITTKLYPTCVKQLQAKRTK
jgi:hypothetical protein